MKESLYISKAAARQRFDELCHQKNNEMPMVTVTREVEIDGKQVTQTYQRRKKAISDGAQNTGKAIIQSFAWQFKRLVKTLPPDMLEEQPSLKTNNVKMAKFRGGLSDRTIRNHIRELKAIGAITGYKFHGSKADFELWINTEVLFGTQEMPQIVGKTTEETYEKSQTQKPVFEPPNGTNFPHRHASSIGNTIVTESKATKKVENHSTIRRQEYGNKLSAGQSGGLSDILAGSIVTQEGGGGRLVTVDNRFRSYLANRESWITPGVHRDYDRLPRTYQHAVGHFWNYARKMLWPTKVFMPLEELSAMDSITAGVYQRIFATNPSESALNQFHKQQLKAIDKAAAYYQKSQNQYPGDPYSKFKPGCGYFDQENPQGFKVAQRWAEKDAAAAHERYGEKVLNDAIRHLKNHNSGKIPQNLKHLTLMQLFRHYETRIKKNFSGEVLSDYYRKAFTLPVFNL